MWKGVTRRQFLTAATGGTVAFAGCGELGGGGETATETAADESTPTDVLTVPTDTPAGHETAAETEPAETTTETATVTPTPADTSTSTATDSEPSGSDGSGGTSGQPDPDPTPTPTVTGTPTPTETSTPTDTPAEGPISKLVIPAGESRSATGVPTYELVKWSHTGRLVIEDGAGFGLTDTETNS